MKPLKTAVLACALIAPLGVGATAASAAAYPVNETELTANPLYESGALPKSTCAEPKVKAGDVKQARNYLDKIIACMGKTWEPHLTKAGLTYSQVKVQHVNKLPKKWCDLETNKDDSQAYYCDQTRTIVFKVGKTWTESPSDLWLFYVASSMYGYHVQNLVGIAEAFDAVPYDKRAELLEQNRRLALQADCLGTASMKSVWPLKGRTTKDWKHFLTLPEGDVAGQERWRGKEPNIRYWLKKGFATGDPASCNTWTASPSKVA
ncbi:neutral zinc metallopeptidase [Nonomuraea candida]|uniref:neutral zinc metallopeptidase n=1 Tax=Nonomuraea candida TaxID=359159 RepID=UPI0009FF2795|nr:neutral zinc metallopeptidase [Nonomuraea candida]